jgi:hypothetical protein
VEKGILYAEVIGIIGLAAYCWINWKEWKTFDSERQTIEIEFKTGQTNSIMQLLAMQRQLDEMKNARMLDERAWIDPYLITRWSDNGYSSSWYDILRFKNIGKTPAFRVFAAIGITNSYGGVPIFKTNFPPNLSTLTLFPNEESRVQSEQMPTSELAQYLDGTKPAYVYGIVIYDDVSGIHHWVRFCRTTYLKTGDAYPAPLGNDTDTNN